VHYLLCAFTEELSIYLCLTRDISEYQNKRTSRMFQIRSIYLMGARRSSTSWVVVTTASPHRKLLPRIIFFSKFTAVIAVYCVATVYVFSVVVIFNGGFIFLD